MPSPRRSNVSSAAGGQQPGGLTPKPIPNIYNDLPSNVPKELIEKHPGFAPMPAGPPVTGAQMAGRRFVSREWSSV